MAIQIQPYTEELAGSVVEFNRRIAPGNVPFEIPEAPVPSWLPKTDGRKIYQEIFLAVEDGSVRGAYTLKHQEFSVGGRILSVAACQMPISEGIVNKRYAMVGVQIVNDALRRQPLAYDLGVGSLDAALVRIHQAMGWRFRVIPFFFKVQNGFQFLRNVRYLRTTRLRRLLFDAAAYSGLGWVGARAARVWLTAGREPHVPAAEEVGEFSTWADELWERCKNRYSLAAVRDANVLNILYPPANARFTRLKILDGGRVTGWAVLLDTAMSDNKYFGNMRVASIVDCLALPEDAGKVIAAAARVMEQRGVDLLISNQSHPAWRRGLIKTGFVQGPSNFILGTSNQLSELLNEVDPAGLGIHINRGDGDGPIHL